MGLDYHYMFLISQGITSKESVALFQHSSGEFNRKKSVLLTTMN